MALRTSTLDGLGPSDLVRWNAAGLDRLTGPVDGPGLGPPNGLIERLDATTERIRRASAASGAEVRIDGLAALAVRADLLGLSRRGRVSCGGACHLVAAADGWLAVSLARPADWELLPAWIGVAAPEREDWTLVHEGCRTRRRDELVAQGALLGLPIGALPDGTDRREVVVDPVGRRDLAAVPTPGTPRGGPRHAHGVANLRVADLSSMWAGPLCGAVLASAGAHVLKVESTARPDGTRQGPPDFFDLLNGTKEPVSLDLRAADGPRRLAALLRTVDVVIESSRPRALRQLGIDAEALLADPDGPRLWVSITGHGRDDHHAGRVAFGDDAAVSGGLVSWIDGEPVFCADAIADPLTGLTAAAAALEALDAPGDPCPALLDVAMSRVAAHFAGTNRIATDTVVSTG